MPCDWSSDVCSRSEEHTSALQSHSHLVCRLLLDKKNLRRTGRGARPFRLGGRRPGAPRPHAHSARPASSHGVSPTRPIPLAEGFIFFFNDTATTEIYTLSLHDALPFNDTATTEIYTLSLHDALPISVVAVS